MAQLYDETTSTELSVYVSLTPEQEVNAVENIALDGTYYKQVIGSPLVTYKLTAFVTESQQDDLMDAEADCDLIKVTVNRGTYYGRISSLSFGDRKAEDYYEASIVLAKEDA